MGFNLEVKDLILVGIFSAIYIVVFFISFMLGFIPFFIPLNGFISSIICGIPFMLYIAKITKFGMITLSSILIGFISMITGGGIVILISSIVFGFLADLIMKKGDYKNWKYIYLGYMVFCLWMMGFAISMFIDRIKYFDSIKDAYGEEYVNTLMSITPNWMFPVMCILTLIGAYLGAILGKKVLTKHFEKAGIV